MTVQVLTTGGTIASRPAPNGSVSVALSGAELIAAAAPVREILRKHSFAFTLADLLTIAREVMSATAGGDGVVVTHGTDTLEETAYLLDLVGPAAPVVLTGAQRHAGEPDCDGPRNIADALLVAGSPQARGLGPLVVMGGRIHAARPAIKAHTLAPDAFRSFDGGPIGEVRQGQVRIWSTPVRPAGFPLPLQLPRVDIVASYVGAGGNQLAACRAGGAQGIVLEALGAGNPTPAVLAEVRTCIDAGLPVLVTSRCAAGPTTPIYGAGGGADLIRAGAVMAGALPSSKARILLSIALASESLHLINAHLR
ncbi:L-asparaginase [Kribbella steppae]|uniref:asparaginase n=1 Tax=Kribbella steppae TaxID=2512223 RepID=A0A4R2H072_9ACTN|nr:asparaginase [Kribbella steppae]TCO17311.1 L-asparaginase [Kribbella steppae]